MSNTTLTPSAAAASFAGVAPGNFPSSALLYITEFRSPTDYPIGGIYPPTPSLADQTLAYGAGFSSVSAPFTAQTRVVRIAAAGTVAIKIGKNPVASGGMGRMVTGVAEYFAVHPGDQLAAIVTS